jgi:hypothetical protein
MADTIGTAWAKAHFGKDSPIIESGQQQKQSCHYQPKHSAPILKRLSYYIN